jgi:hypothetical protein
MPLDDSDVTRTGGVGQVQEVVTALVLVALVGVGGAGSRWTGAERALYRLAEWAPPWSPASTVRGA